MMRNELLAAIDWMNGWQVQSGPRAGEIIAAHDLPESFLRTLETVYMLDRPEIDHALTVERLGSTRHRRFVAWAQHWRMSRRIERLARIRQARDQRRIRDLREREVDLQHALRKVRDDIHALQG